MGMIDEFQNEHPDIKVETQSVAFAEIKKQLSIGVAANQLPDVTLCDTVDNVSFAAMGAAVDITEEVEGWGELENYFEAPAQSAYYDGNIMEYHFTAIVWQSCTIRIYLMRWVFLIQPMTGPGMSLENWLHRLRQTIIMD